MATKKPAKKATKFQPGVSGNPAGRPKGSGMAGQLRKAIENDAADIVQALAKQAKAGDVQAARVLLDRVCPPLKGETRAVTVQGMDKGSLTERAAAALDAAATGNLPPDTAAALVQAVGTLARVTEIDELEKRLSKLEQLNEVKP